MPRYRNDEAQRERLSEAVFTTLADLGPAGLTLRSVAARAGCTTGLVLHTFSDKRALLLHARDVLHERTKQRADLLESGAAGPGAAVRAVTLGALPTDAETLAEARVWVGFLAAALGDPVLREHHARKSRAFTERLTRLLAVAADLSVVVAAERASALAAAVEGIATLAAGDPQQWSAPRQRAALDIVLDAVLAASEPETRTRPV
ncbi:TetR/AcrR family transcriptional regulator [Curtobacterium sp. MCSS17_008]|uniref:TetR/AcrR family transcriptional regulator n=1 Tax=Curtobacterium sp. MCSS17_008 TaxID=2175647 RepID=UPI000DA7AD00|nr:TetR family transcriptional regulator C-terminal domain-containing protein [Curtobacterium sp. MCSS17_008]PZF57247.1 TetR/AcrR family transcriptional regulator [Curtobacterium sp. MCSS17_008]